MQDDNLFGLPGYVVVSMRNVFSNYEDINKVILYGSRATGNYRTGSDIDLCIDSADLEDEKLLTIMEQLDELSLPWKIDLSLKRDIDNQALLKHIENAGVEIYAKLGGVDRLTT